MSDVQFDSEQGFERPNISRGPKGLAGLMIRWGLAKDEAGAQKVLIGIAIAAIVLAILIQIL